MLEFLKRKANAANEPNPVWDFWHADFIGDAGDFFPAPANPQLAEVGDCVVFHGEYGNYYAVVLAVEETEWHTHYRLDIDMGTDRLDWVWTTEERVSLLYKATAMDFAAAIAV